MSTTTNVVNEIVEAIRAAEKIMLVTHVGPDGDGLGCQVALVHALRDMGKEAYIVNQDKAASAYDILGLDELVEKEPADDYDLGISVDAPEFDRLGKAADRLKACKKMIKIDHHVSDDRFGDINWIKASAAATGEMIVELFDAGGFKFNPAGATGAYMAIVHDTGCFRYSNTTAGTLRAAARLIEEGARSFEVNTAMYDSKSHAQVKLTAEVMRNVEIFSNGRGAVATIPQSLMDACGATKDDTEDIVEGVRSIEGVEVSIMLREQGPGEVKGSLRSKLNANVRLVAEIFGGGGHNKAAGVTFHEPIDDAKKKLVAEVEKILA